MPHLFAEANVNFDTKFFAELAREGQNGLIVALIVSFLLLTLIFAALSAWGRYCEMRRFERREIEKDKDLKQLKIDDIESRERLVEHQAELSNNMLHLTEFVKDSNEKIHEQLESVGDEVSALTSGIGTMRAKLNDHDRLLDKHEKSIDEYGKTIAVHEEAIENLSKDAATNIEARENERKKNGRKN